MSIDSDLYEDIGFIKKGVINVEKKLDVFTTEQQRRDDRINKVEVAQSNLEGRFSVFLKVFYAIIGTVFFAIGSLIVKVFWFGVRHMP